MSCSGEYNDVAEVKALIQENHDLRQQAQRYREEMNELLRQFERADRDFVRTIETAMEAKRHAR